VSDPVFDIVRENPEKKHVAQDMHETGVDEHAGNKRQVGRRTRGMKNVIGDRAETKNKIVDVPSQRSFVNKNQNIDG
jgi:hypothetical protein